MRSFSQAKQDIFVLSSLPNKFGGYFLDIGAAMPRENNNTFLLESEYGWDGLLFEIDPRHKPGLKGRSAKLIFEDATKIDYKRLFEDNNVPKVIDYLSLDLDPPTATLEVLKRLPLEEYSFRCITFEHDSYWFGDSVRQESRDILLSFGYTLEVPNVECTDGPFEDWYTKNI